MRVSDNQSHPHIVSKQTQSPDLPGDPGINPSPQTLQDVLDLSIDFFYVSPVLNNLGIHLTPAPEARYETLFVVYRAPADRKARDETYASCRPILYRRCTRRPSPFSTS